MCRGGGQLIFGEALREAYDAKLRRGMTQEAFDDRKPMPPAPTVSRTRRSARPASKSVEFAAPAIVFPRTTIRLAEIDRV